MSEVDFLTAGFRRFGYFPTESSEHGAESCHGSCGFVAPTLTGPYEPLNGSGLVIRNPPAHPTQAYAWLVLPDPRVESFFDYPFTIDGATSGVAAPTLTLELNGTRIALARECLSG